jgi:hypothetical protein
MQSCVAAINAERNWSGAGLSQPEDKGLPVAFHARIMASGGGFHIGSRFGFSPHMPFRGRLRPVALVESLPQQSFNDCLPADVQARGALVELPKHSLSEIDIHTPDRSDHGELVGKEF